MTGRVHTHQGVKVYHREGGALKFRGQDHSRYLLGKDIRQHSDNRPEKRGYPNTGDGKPKHKGRNEPLHSKRGQPKTQDTIKKVVKAIEKFIP